MDMFPIVRKEHLMDYRYNVFGTTMCIKARDGQWQLFKVSASGILSRFHDVVIPAHLTEQEFRTFLDDMFHEHATESEPDVVPLQHNR